MIGFSVFIMLQQVQTASAQTTKLNAEKNLSKLGIILITPVPPTANFVKAVRTGNMVYLSGHGPDKPAGGQVTGK